MSVISIPTPFNIDLEFNVAPFWRRLLAWVIDTLLQFLYGLAYFLIIVKDFDDNSTISWIAFVMFCVLPITFYHFLMEWLFGGQSLGKKALRIRVVNMLGNEPSVSQYLIRLLFRSVSLIPFLAAIITDIMGPDAILGDTILFFLAIGIFIMFILSPKGQRLGDRLANTLVIEKRAEADIHKTIFREIGDTNYTARYPEVMRLSDRDINGIRNLLSMKPGRDTDAYMDRIAMRVVSILNVKADTDSRTFLEHLLFDYNVLSKR